MKTMKAVICKRYGPPDVLKISHVEKPIPRQDEVLIKIHATSVTNSDIFIRSSKIPFPIIIPFRLMIGIVRPRNQIIGEVFSGEIEAIGDRIERFKTGDKVYGFTGLSLGAYAEYKCMKESDSRQGCLAKMPANIDFEEATSAAYGGLLAFQYMEKGEISKGSNVLVYGASGTSGTMAVQHAKYLGARVTGVCSARNINFVKSLGADKVLDYTNQDSVKELEQYDFILDAVGKARTSPLKTACKKSLSKAGKYVSIDDGNLILKSDRLEQIAKVIEAGHVKPVTDRVYPLEQIAEAHKYVEGGHKRGNVAISIKA